jgi:hypothetical protein
MSQIRAGRLLIHRLPARQNGATSRTDPTAVGEGKPGARTPPQRPAGPDREPRSPVRGVWRSACGVLCETTGEILEKDRVLHDNLLVDRRDVVQTIRERAHNRVTSGHSRVQGTCCRRG